jgi:hypothetical protein
MYFDLIKFSQRQRLLYYPFDKPFSQVEEKQQPVGKDEEGSPLYKCHDCGKPVSENEIDFWYKPGDGLPYSLSVNFTENDVHEFSAAVKNIIDIYLAEYNKENPDIENIKDIISNQIKSLPHLDKINNLAQIIGQEDYFSSRDGVYLFVKRYLEEFIESGNVDALSRISQRSTQQIEDSLFEDIEKASKFEIPLSHPVCDDCSKKYPECDDCEEVILPGDNYYTLSNDDLVCEKCFENGEYGICSECGSIEYRDNMHWVENHEAEYCDKCYDDITVDYEDFEGEIENAAVGKEYPFKDWFTNDSNRIYMDFHPNLNLSENDSQVTDFLKSYNCKVSADEYIKGYCLFDGRTFKIGKLLDKIRSDEIKKLRKTSEDPEEVERESVNINSTIENLKNLFMNSTNRRSGKKSKLNIVISQDIHDIGSMSTGRDWKSCMELGEGSYHQNVFCEVAEGGLIAYLIEDNDEDIEHPLARILIRRFENDEGQSLALAENTVYGNAPSGFLKQVTEWLDSRQGHLPKGEYTRMGGDYSDTYQSEYELAFNSICNMIKTACGDSNWYSLMNNAQRVLQFLQK